MAIKYNPSTKGRLITRKNPLFSQYCSMRYNYLGPHAVTHSTAKASSHSCCKMEINPVAVIRLLTLSPKHATPMSRCADRRQFVMHNLSSMSTERVSLLKDME